MKKILSLLLALTMVFSLCACGGTSNQTSSTSNNDVSSSEKDIKDAYIGVWENIGDTSSDDRYVHQFKVYKGGSGERIILDEDVSEPIVLPFTWEITDDVFNMILTDFGETNKMGFVMENDILTSVNGEYEFKKVGN